MNLFCVICSNFILSIYLDIIVVILCNFVYDSNLAPINHLFSVTISLKEQYQYLHIFPTLIKNQSNINVQNTLQCNIISSSAI